jgi:cytochrome c-type biogenesis protein CcmH/NrfG
MPAQSAGPGWQAKQAYLLSVICLLLGFMLGYLLRGSASTQPAATVPASQADAAAPAMPGHSGQMPTLDQMKHMADKKAEPLLAKMRTNPNDPGVLIQIGNIYRSTHQFKDASDYYQKALQLDPRNVAIRTELSSCLYYTGDIEGALAQLHQALATDPKDSNSLFNLGMIEWREKKDANSALAAWTQLLQSNPSLAADKKTQVQKLIAEVKEQSKTVKN